MKIYRDNEEVIIKLGKDVLLGNDILVVFKNIVKRVVKNGVVGKGI